MRLADTRNAVWVKKCHERVGENLKYISTTATVRDIDRIYRALEGDDVPINYWGFSYGTLIGSYLVNMSVIYLRRISMSCSKRLLGSQHVLGKLLSTV